MNTRTAKLIPVTYRVFRQQSEELKDLSTSTRIPQSALVREAVEDLLQKYRRKR